tara:strand:- start:141181 stop:142056 length:876 start_codon:yes stop_codon:yes gene_type:complete
MDTNELATRMKMYELSTPHRIPSLMPIVVRLDGRSFSTFTKDMNRPFDTQFHEAMCALTAFLVERTNATIGYTQSDEISLVFLNTNYKSDHLFGGRKQKIESLLAGMASAFFMTQVQQYWPDKLVDFPHFDARAVAFPNEVEAYNCIVWREQDATKNSVQLLGQSYYKHSRLVLLSNKAIQHALFTEHNVNWNDLEPWQKRGTYFQQRKVDGVRCAVALDMPPITRCSNAMGVLLRGEQPAELFMSWPKPLDTNEARMEDGTLASLEKRKQQVLASMGVPSDIIGANGGYK